VRSTRAGSANALVLHPPAGDVDTVPLRLGVDEPLVGDDVEVLAGEPHLHRLVRGSHLHAHQSSAADAYVHVCGRDRDAGGPVPRLHDFVRRAPGYGAGSANTGRVEGTACPVDRPTRDPSRGSAAAQLASSGSLVVEVDACCYLDGEDRGDEHVDGCAERGPPSGVGDVAVSFLPEVFEAVARVAGNE